jgi:hypothetical protein
MKVNLSLFLLNDFLSFHYPVYRTHGRDKPMRKKKFFFENDLNNSSFHQLFSRTISSFY